MMKVFRSLPPHSLMQVSSRLQPEMVDSGNASADDVSNHLLNCAFADSAGERRIVSFPVSVLNSDAEKVWHGAAIQH